MGRLQDYFRGQHVYPRKYDNRASTLLQRADRAGHDLEGYLYHLRQKHLWPLVDAARFLSMPVNLTGPLNPEFREDLAFLKSWYKYQEQPEGAAISHHGISKNYGGARVSFLAYGGAVDYGTLPVFVFEFKDLVPTRYRGGYHSGKSLTALSAEDIHYMRRMLKDYFGFIKGEWNGLSQLTVSFAVEGGEPHPAIPRMREEYRSRSLGVSYKDRPRPILPEGWL